MPDERSTLKIRPETHRQLQEVATVYNAKLYGVVAWMASGWELLTPEQRAKAMATASNSSPSVAKPRQSDTARSPKQSPKRDGLGRRRVG